MDTWATGHQQLAKQMTDAADESVRTYTPLFDEQLQGTSGQALQSSLAANVNDWRRDAADHEDAAKALGHAADYLRGLQADLSDIITAYGRAYDSALKNRNSWTATLAATAIEAKAQLEAAAASQHAADRITSALDGAYGTYPRPEPGYTLPPGPILGKVLNA